MKKNISSVIKNIPKFVDFIVVVNDLSTDNTSKILKSLEKKNKRLVVIHHKKNQGVGGAIASGYQWARDNEMDAAVVMAGDGQMDPNDLLQLLEPVICENVNYTKGNRLLYPWIHRPYSKGKILGQQCFIFTNEGRFRLLARVGLSVRLHSYR